MLVGCLLRHFKVYENIVFIPISPQTDRKISIFTGNNGVGKSSILEAIDHFFHQTGWLINTKGKKQDAYVAPIFLINKSEFISRINKDLLEEISNYFWNVSFDSANLLAISKSDSLKKFLSYKDSIKHNYGTESHYLFLVGLKYPNEAPDFLTFDNDIRELLADKDFDNNEIDKLYKDICDFYSYIYIPVESSIQDLLKLESFELQELIDKDILDEIENILNQEIKIPRELLGRHRGPKEINSSPLKLINSSLDKFMEDANVSIQSLGQEYSFSTDRNQKKSLSAQDIRDRILERYFSIRTLKKEGKLIENLSSGEQRIALFDIAYSLLSQGKSTKKKLILAIDEPEASMHMSQCYRQFIRLSEIGSKFSHQILMTSHWYGFLPVLDKGYINHIEQLENLSITQHSLSSITSEQKRLPDEISLKSMFDLVSSVIGMMRSETTNWLVCEGVDDQIYLKAFLKGKVDNLCILPVGGIDNVVKLYNYLYTPLSEKTEEKRISGKIICITDTDKRPVYPANHRSLKNNLLSIRRLQLKSDVLKLVELNPSSERHETAIEDLLDTQLFFETISKVVETHNDDSIKALLSELELDENLTYTGFSNDLQSIRGKNVPSHLRKGELVSFLKRHDIKYQVAGTYVQLLEQSGKEIPKWVDSLADLFLDRINSPNI
jgi:ABC-type Mn2+/Zn2+ transport system ATPase subunit